MNKLKKVFVFFCVMSLFCISCGKQTNSEQPIVEAVKSSENNVTAINLDSVSLFMEYDKTEAIQVSENVTRKFLYLNGVMTVIVDFKNGPMKEPDPFHSHPEEQICYVAEGKVLVIIGDKKQELKAGDMFMVPSDVPHTVQSLTDNLRLIDCFNPVRKDFIK